MKQSWDEIDVETQAYLLAFDQIRQEEDVKEQIEFAKFSMPRL